MFALAICSIALILPLPLTAQDEVQYAKRLAEVGYPDLARLQLEKVESSYKPVVKGEILLQKASRQSDPVKKAKMTGRALKPMKRFIEENPDHKRNLQARFTYADTLRKAGSAWTDVLKEGGGEDTSEAVQEGSSYYKEAQKVYRDIGNIAKEQIDKTRAKYFEIVTFYDTSRLYKAADQQKKVIELLRKLVKGVEDFMWMTGGGGPPSKRLSLYGAVSFYELYRIFQEKGQEEKANTYRENSESYFSTVIKNMDRLQKDQVRLDRERFQIWRDLVLRGYYFWTRVLNDTDQYDKALSKSGEALSEFSRTNNILTRQPGDAIQPLEFPPGKALMLERAKAFFRTAQKQKAIEIANRVANRGGGWGQKAKQLVSKWAKMVGRTISVETWLNMVDDALQRGNLHESLSNARNGLGAISTEEQRIRWKWKLYDRLALIYTRLERWYEAGLVYERLHDEFHDVLDLPAERKDGEGEMTKLEKVLRDERAGEDQTEFEKLRAMVPRSNYQAAKSIGFARRETGLDQDKSKFQELLKHLSQEHGDTEWAAKTNLLLANLYRKNDKFDKAIEKYNTTQKGGSVWEEAQVKVGYTYFQKGDTLAKNDKKEAARKAFQKAIDTFRSYLDYTKENPGGDASERRTWVWNALDGMAFTFLHDAYGKPKEVLNLLTNKRLQDYDFSTSVHTSSLVYRMNAYMMLENWKKAGETAMTLYKEYPGAQDTIDALGSLASRFEEIKEAEQKKKDVNVERLNRFWKMSSKYYYRWMDLKLRKQDTVSRSDLFAVAMIIKRYGTRTGDQTYLKRSGELLQTLLSGQFKGRGVSLAGGNVPSKNELRQELASVYVNRGQHQKAVEIYDQLLKPYENDEDKLAPGWLLMGQAELFIKLYEKYKGEGNNQQAGTYLDRARSVLYKMYDNTSSGSDPWWKIRYYLLKLNISERNVSRAEKSLDMLRRQGKKPFDGRQAKFQKLIDQLEEIKPGK